MFVAGVYAVVMFGGIPGSLLNSGSSSPDSAEQDVVALDIFVLNNVLPGSCGGNLRSSSDEAGLVVESGDDLEQKGVGRSIGQSEGEPAPSNG